MKLVVVVSPLNTTSLTPVFNKTNQHEEVKSTPIKVVATAPLMLIISVRYCALSDAGAEQAWTAESWAACSGPGCFWEEGGDHAKPPGKRHHSRGHQCWIMNHAWPDLTALLPSWGIQGQLRKWRIKSRTYEKVAKLTQHIPAPPLEAPQTESGSNLRGAKPKTGRIDALILD